MPREYNIAIGSGLAQELRAQLAGRVLEFPQCWYEDKSGYIRLIAGDECGAYDEFAFEHDDGTWKLLSSTIRPVVLCHEAIRK